MFNWLVKKKDMTPADEKLEQIKNLLFPPMKLIEELDKDGSLFKYHVDYSADMNLDAALIDLQEGHNDITSQQTIGEVVKTLIKVRNILDAHAELDKDARYIIVDSQNTEDPSDIRA